jgi:hypothetical protein
LIIQEKICVGKSLPARFAFAVVTSLSGNLPIDFVGELARSALYAADGRFGKESGCAVQKQAEHPDRR